MKHLLHKGCALLPPPLPCRAPVGIATPAPRDGVAGRVSVRWGRVTVGQHHAGWHGVGCKVRTIGTVADSIRIYFLPLVLLSLRTRARSGRDIVLTINTPVSKIRGRQVLAIHKNLTHFFLSMKETQ